VQEGLLWSYLIIFLADASTLSYIQLEISAAAVFNETTIRKWLEGKNPDPEAMAGVVERFSLSCAAFCVATYVLGVRS